MIWLGDGITFLWRRDLQALPVSVEILYLGRKDSQAFIYMCTSVRVYIYTITYIYVYIYGFVGLYVYIYVYLLVLYV